MQAFDVMSSNVLSVSPDMAVREAAAFFVAHGISGAPVIDAQGHLVGMITESDLLHRAEVGTDRHRRSWWLDMFSTHRDAVDYVKAHARRVRDLMTVSVVTVEGGTELGEVANLLESHRIRSIPVLRENEVIGIVSRSHLVQALAVAPVETNPQQVVSDREIRAMLLGEITGHGWAFSGGNIIVQSGVVHLYGAYVGFAEQLQAMRVAAESIPGVRAVEDHTNPLPSMVGI